MNDITAIGTLSPDLSPPGCLVFDEELRCRDAVLAVWTSAEH